MGLSLALLFLVSVFYLLAYVLDVIVPINKTFIIFSIPKEPAYDGRLPMEMFYNCFDNSFNIVLWLAAFVCCPSIQ